VIARDRRKEVGSYATAAAGSTVAFEPESL
jgi:hypothetical protein